MKYLISLFIILPTLSFGQSITWDNPMVVNENNSIGHTRPKIGVNKDGDAVIMWGKANNLGVYVSTLSGNTFSSPLKITPNGINAFVQSWAGPGMEVLDDIVFVAFKAQPENAGFVYVVKSTDGGKTFGDTVRVSENNWSRFPEVAILPNGNPVVTFMEFDPNFKDPRYVVSVSNDGGKSFMDAINASKKAPGEACDCCPGFIMADNDNITILFRNNDNNLRDIWASISDDGGKTFDLVEDIDESGWMIGGCPSTGAEAISLGDSLISVWMNGSTGNSMIKVGTSSMSDLSVGYNAEITPEISNGNQNYPKIAGDDDLLAVTWQEVANSSRNVKLALSITGPSGLQKFTPVQVNENSTGVQQSPAIAFDGEYLHIVWQDLTARKLMYRRGKVNTTASVSNVKEVSMSVYPNPTESILNVSYNLSRNESAAVKLLDITGQPVNIDMNQTESRMELDVSSLASGFYFIEVTINSQHWTEKIWIR